MKFHETIISIKNITHPQVYFHEAKQLLEMFVWQKDGMYQRVYTCQNGKIRLQSKQKIGTYTYAKRINATYILVCKYQSVQVIKLPFS